MNTQLHVLLVEDDKEIRNLVARYLNANQFRVTVARDAKEMDHALATGRFDLILLDLMLPGEDGLSICRRLRHTTTIPIVMLSARGEEADRIVGLEVGADDYVTKPFSSRELLARIRAVLRRSSQSLRQIQTSEVQHFEFLGWHLDRSSRHVKTPSGSTATLTSAEFDLLIVFCERPGLILSRDQLLDLTQGRSAQPFERSIDILISRLRRKLANGDDSAEMIRTIRAEGYVFTPKVTTS